ncbi:uncharacterized protein LOC115452736 [Manduca sexta]|uniref:uncharacterized protein LOC115452736 n=1 Tax=Manduca sexta TaxID=7130 RepID=UPI00188F0D9A|nr:uncharacterized protein LOC115452736 [Manduca sexta]
MTITIMSRVGRVGPAQMKKLLDLLSEDGVLEDGKILYTETTRQNFWKRIATQLNAVNGGVYKNTWQWCKMWADWKTKTKKKANILFHRKKYKVEQKIVAFTDLELRLLKMIKYPFDDSSDSLQLDMLVDKTDDVDNTVDELQNQDFVIEDYIVERMSSNDDDKTEHFVENNETNFCSVNVQDKYDTGDCSSGTYKEEKVKIKGKSYKRKKISLEEYKIRTTMELEKEKVQQKTEELRLRALELKVKGDELKLKELEMNKINYMTNIEEEKLKCLKEISSCLKELVERNRSGNLRFTNML